MSYILQDYDNALKQILEQGVRKKNRTGVETLSVFCIQSRYKIDEYFPLLTKRKIWPKSMFAELLWFISGSANNKDLQKLGADFWTPWVDAEFEKRNGYAEGSLGPIYGFQLRHFGGEYGNGIGGMAGSQSSKTPNNVCPNYYGFGGFDQLKAMVDTLRADPDSRRNLFSLWNPQQIKSMRIPPCHYTFQVYTDKNNLSGVLTQRSCDFPVGVPYNIAFYSALIYLLARETGYTSYEFVHHTVDSHIYVDQIPAVEEYLGRQERGCPKLTVKKAKNIDSYSMEDFELTDYNPDEVIKIPVAV